MLLRGLRRLARLGGRRDKRRVAHAHHVWGRTTHHREGMGRSGRESRNGRSRGDGRTDDAQRRGGATRDQGGSVDGLVIGRGAGLRRRSAGTEWAGASAAWPSSSGAGGERERGWREGRLWEGKRRGGGMRGGCSLTGRCGLLDWTHTHPCALDPDRGIRIRKRPLALPSILSLSPPVLCCCSPAACAHGPRHCPRFSSAFFFPPGRPHRRATANPGTGAGGIAGESRCTLAYLTPPLVPSRPRSAPACSLWPLLLQPPLPVPLAARALPSLHRNRRDESARQRLAH